MKEDISKIPSWQPWAEIKMPEKAPGGQGEDLEGNLIPGEIGVLDACSAPLQKDEISVRFWDEKGDPIISQREGSP